MPRFITIPFDSPGLVSVSEGFTFSLANDLGLTVTEKEVELGLALFGGASPVLVLAAEKFRISTGVCIKIHKRRMI